MKKWNQKMQNVHTFWDPENGPGREVDIIRSDKSIVNNYSGIKFEHGMQVLMRVASELIDIQENPEPILDEWGRTEGACL